MSGRHALAPMKDARSMSIEQLGEAVGNGAGGVA